jgi:phosphatidylglycerophosphatase A
MRDRLVKLMATGLGVGYLPVGPGLAGSVVGVGWWWVARDQLWLIPIGALVAGMVADRAAKLFGHLDPPCVVIDEICAVPVALLALSEQWELVTGFVLFRIFDVWKPWPIRQMQAWPGGWGIVGDDVLAAGYACATTHAVGWVLSRVV